MSEVLLSIRKILAENWYRFQLGMSFLTILNFGLLVITASDKIKSILPLKITELVIILIPLAFIITLIIGYIMESVVKFPQEHEKELLKRSPNWILTHEKLDKILIELEKK